MTQQPNKPGGNFKDDGTPRDPEDEQAVRNQGHATPEDYPEKARGPLAGEDPDLV